MLWFQARFFCSQVCGHTSKNTFVKLIPDHIHPLQSHSQLPVRLSSEQNIHVTSKHWKWIKEILYSAAAFTLDFLLHRFQKEWISSTLVPLLNDYRFTRPPNATCNEMHRYLRYPLTKKLRSGQEWWWTERFVEERKSVSTDRALHDKILTTESAILLELARRIKKITKD